MRRSTTGTVRSRCARPATATATTRSPSTFGSPRPTCAPRENGAHMSGDGTLSLCQVPLDGTQEHLSRDNPPRWIRPTSRSYSRSYKWTFRPCASMAASPGSRVAIKTPRLLPARWPLLLPQVLSLSLSTIGRAVGSSLTSVTIRLTSRLYSCRQDHPPALHVDRGGLGTTRRRAHAIGDPPALAEGVLLGDHCDSSVRGERRNASHSAAA